MAGGNRARGQGGKEATAQINLKKAYSFLLNAIQLFSRFD